MTFTEILDRQMAIRGINKNILSKESGVPYTTIDGFYKKGSDNVKLSTLKKLATYFDCSIDSLVGYVTSEDEEQFTPRELEMIEEYKQFLIYKRGGTDG